MGAPWVFIGVGGIAAAAVLAWLYLRQRRELGRLARAVRACDSRVNGRLAVGMRSPEVVALADAVSWAKDQGILKPSAKVLTDSISAISVGVIDGTPMLDLPYVEDVRAETDMNVVQTGDGRFIEVQGTAEHAPFNRDELNELLDLATLGNARLAEAQKLALEAPLMERVEVRP